MHIVIYEKYLARNIISLHSWQEITMTVQVDFLGGDLTQEFGLPALIPSVIRPNQYRDLIVAQINELNQSNPTSNYIFDITTAAQFIKVWLCHKTTRQQTKCILDICEKTICIYNQCSGRDEKRKIIVVAIVNKNNKTDRIEFESWKEVYDNRSEYIPILSQYL